VVCSLFGWTSAIKETTHLSGTVSWNQAYDASHATCTLLCQAMLNVAEMKNSHPALCGGNSGVNLVTWFNAHVEFQFKCRGKASVIFRWDEFI